MWMGWDSKKGHGADFLKRDERAVVARVALLTLCPVPAEGSPRGVKVTEPAVEVLAVCSPVFWLLPAMPPAPHISPVVQSKKRGWGQEAGLFCKDPGGQTSLWTIHSALL